MIFRLLFKVTSRQQAQLMLLISWKQLILKNLVTCIFVLYTTYSTLYS